LTSDGSIIGNRRRTSGVSASAAAGPALQPPATPAATTTAIAEV